MDDVERVQAGLNEAGSTVRAAQTVLSQGGLIDLSELEKFIKNLCGSVAILPKGQGSKIKIELVKLIDNLNELASLITAQRDSLSGELKSLTDNKRAVSAYGSGANVSQKKPKK